MDKEQQFKPGDVVCIESSGFGGGKAIDTVKRITPKGQVILEKSGCKYWQSGRQIKSDPWHWTRIKIATQEDFDDIERSNLAFKIANKIAKVDLKELSLDKLRRIKAILDEEAP